MFSGSVTDSKGNPSSPYSFKKEFYQQVGKKVE